MYNQPVLYHVCADTLVMEFTWFLTLYEDYYCLPYSDMYSV